MYEDRELRCITPWKDVYANFTEQGRLVSVLAYDDKRHFTVIVDLGAASECGSGKRPTQLRKAVVEARRVAAIDHFLVWPDIVCTNGAQHESLSFDVDPLFMTDEGMSPREQQSFTA
jgi:hypothetical protein